MNYKPDEATLAAYLYGELAKDEQEKVNSYLEVNPEVRDEIEGIQSARKFVGKLEDKEVTAPSFVFEDAATVVVSRRSSSFNSFVKSTLALAASIILLILVGYSTQLKISSSDDGIQLSFGSQPALNTTGNDFNEAKIKAWMQETLAVNNENLINKISEVEKDLGGQLKSSLNKNHLTNYKVDQNVIDQYVNQIKFENRNIILNLMEVSERDQKQYMDELMADFAKFLESQRQDDLDAIQGHINSLVENADNDHGEYRISEE